MLPAGVRRLAQGRGDLPHRALPSDHVDDRPGQTNLRGGRGLTVAVITASVVGGAARGGGPDPCPAASRGLAGVPLPTGSDFAVAVPGAPIPAGPVAAVPVLAGLLSAGPVTAGPITAGSIAATVLVTRVPAPAGATTALTTATAAVPAPRHTADGTGDLTNHSRAAISVPGPTPGRAFTATRATGTVPANPAIPGVPTSTLTITTAAASHHTDGTDDLTDNAGSTTSPGTTAPTGGRALVPPSAAARRHAPDDMIELDDVATLRSPAIACDEATTALRHLVARPAGSPVGHRWQCPAVPAADAVPRAGAPRAGAGRTRALRRSGPCG
jgi:hypothetical protein